ncbi:MAG: 3-oxo-tetronate kinase [Mycetocola sp.]
MSGYALGAVADDLTGACDLAAGLTEAGLPAAVLLRLPDEAPRAAAAVVALKTRTAPVDAAVRSSAEAVRWLLDAGTDWIYQKYCSTFDSTADGNIGPVADAMAAVIEEHSPRGCFLTSVGTPATPAVGRTQYQGYLFVGDRLLSESSMRDHPITPMRDSDLVRVLGGQTDVPVGLVPLPSVRMGAEDLVTAIDVAAGHGARHVLVDALTDDDLDRIAAALVDGERRRTCLISGAAGLGTAVGRLLAARLDERSDEPALPAVVGDRRLIVAGSASERSREQEAAFPGLVLRLDPRDLVAGGDAVGVLLGTLGEALEASADPVLVTATTAPVEVRAAQDELGAERAAALLETALATVAARAVDTLGVTRILVAGGETSGAVAGALGLRSLHVASVIGPGLAWMVSDDTRHPIGVLFKPGNFGDVELYTRAWESEP